MNDNLLRAIASVVMALSLRADDSRPADFLTAHPVWRIRIEIFPQQVQKLRANAREYVPATVQIDDEVIREAGLHLKGSSGSFRAINDKPGLTLEFDKFIQGQEFHGLRKIHLNNSVEDASYLKEQLGNDLFRAAGIPAPRVAHALVELNGRKLGFYVLKEGFTADFIGRHFARADGSLYDTDEGHDVNLPMKRHLGPVVDNDQLALQQLAAASREPSLDRRWERLHQTLDIDRFLTFMAMEIMICHWDGYCLGRNNFRIYHDPTTNKIVFLPSGMDQIFSKADLRWKPDMAGLVARAIMEVPAGRQQYAARFRALFDTLFVSAEVANRVNRILSDLRPALKARDFALMRREASDLRAQIARREVFLGKQLIAPEPEIPQFDNDIARLLGWVPVGEPERGKMLENAGEHGKMVLRIMAGPKTSHSWKTAIRLKQGRYRFEGKAKVAGVTALSFGKNHGASLRIEGTAQRSASLRGTSNWKTLTTDFDVSAPEAEVVLICELRASAGEAMFDRSSLTIVRLR